jgi:O-antigen/teichoic acid export membrane protein
MPIMLGVAQGLQRYVLLASAMVVGTVARVFLLVIALALGLGTPGAIAASLVGGAIAVAVPGVTQHTWFRRPSRKTPVPKHEILRYLIPVLMGVLAFTALTTIDVLVAKAALSDHSAGVYGSAALIGRIALYVPAAIVTVLVPKTVSRAARGDRTEDLFALSVGVTLLAALVLDALYALLPDPIVRIAFGESFRDATSLLWLFGTAMTIYAVLNVILIYELARGSSMPSMLMLVAALVEFSVYLFVHSSPTEIIGVSIATGGVLLVALVALQPASTRLAIARLRPSHFAAAIGRR